MEVAFQSSPHRLLNMSNNMKAMKKILMVMLVLSGMSVKANAQWFVAGGANLGYIKDKFQLALKPSAGYEFSERWASSEK